MKLIFFLINMNLGGTEKSFLNLVDALPKDYEIDLLLFEEKGELLKYLPKNVNLKIIDNHSEINEFIQIGCRRYAFEQLKKGKFFYFLKNILVFLLFKLKLIKHTFYGISNLVKKQSGTYDFAVAWAGPHDFISYYTLNYVAAKKKYQWIHFDISCVIRNVDFGKKFYPIFDCVFCVSENAKNTFAEIFSKAKTKVFENIISEKEIKRLAKNGDSFTDDYNGFKILTLGRLSEEKGQQMIPEIVKRLKDDGFNFRWYLIGDGKLKKPIEDDIQKLGIEDELKLLGKKINPYPFLRDCDLYVQTSLHEGYCLTLHEAKIFNRPVVTTAVLSASNIITNNEDGLIVPIIPEQIYLGIQKMMTNSELTKKFTKFVKRDELQKPNKIRKYF